MQFWLFISFKNCQNIIVTEILALLNEIYYKNIESLYLHK